MTDPATYLLVAEDDDLFVPLARALPGLAGRRVNITGLSNGPRPLFAALTDAAALSAVRGALPGVPLVFLAAPGADAAGVAAMAAGADDYLLTDNLSRLAALAARWRRRPAADDEGLSRAHTALLRLARSRAFQGDNLIDDLREITELAANALNVGRSSVWLYDSVRTRIRCIDLYEPAERRHSEGMELRFKDHPAYFLALDRQKMIVAHDALADPRTAAYGPHYLTPRGITAMLDVAVREGGELVGVICLEHVGGPRRWTMAEEVFACAFADLVSLALEANERAFAQSALRHSQSRFRDFFDHTPQGVVFFDVLSPHRFVLEDLNPAAERLFARPRADLIGRAAEAVLPRGLYDVLCRSLVLCLEADRPTVSEQRWPADGGPRHVEAILVPSRPPGHPVQRLAACFRDITDRKAFEQTLSDREETFRRLLESASIIPWEADPATLRFTYVGPQAGPRFGYPLAEWLGEGFWARSIHPDDRDPTVTACAEHTALLADHVLEYRMLTASGRVVWVTDLISPAVGSEGQVMLSGFLIDVTARREAEEQVRRLNADLERLVRERTAELDAANKELEAFSYSVSHDLRAPLRAIDGFSRAVLEDCGHCLDDDGRAALGRVRAASRRMSELIDDLLKLSRVSRVEMSRVPIDLSDLARDIAAALSRQAPERSVEWVIEPGLLAEGDPRLTRVALENLLGNAWKYTSRNPAARIAFGAEGGAFFVRDDGAGFDPRYAAKLFQPFQRLHRSDEFDGHGIGLATVQRVVARHGGRAWAEGTPGGGATFYFTLGGPAVDERVILLVEDNPDDVALTLRAFKKNHILNPVVVAHDGVEALDYLLGTGPHAGRNVAALPAVVLLDVKLPRIDGLEVLRRLRADERTRLLRVVMLTSSVEEQDLSQAYALGANSYIRKPVDFDRFLEAVGRLGMYWLLMNESPPAPASPTEGP